MKVNGTKTSPVIRIRVLLESLEKLLELIERMKAFFNHFYKSETAMSVVELSIKALLAFECMSELHDKLTIKFKEDELAELGLLSKEMEDELADFLHRCFIGHWTIHQIKPGKIL